MSTIHTQLKDLTTIFFIIILIIVCIITALNIKNTCSDSSKEGWFVYKDNNFGSYQTGYSDPIAFYNRPEYRKPYRYPIGFKTDHPIQHIGSLNPWA
jgi:hypothetical protein